MWSRRPTKLAEMRHFAREVDLRKERPFWRRQAGPEHRDKVASGRRYEACSAPVRLQSVARVLLASKLLQELEQRMGAVPLSRLRACRWMTQCVVPPRRPFKLSIDSRPKPTTAEQEGRASLGRLRLWMPMGQPGRLETRDMPANIDSVPGGT